MSTPQKPPTPASTPTLARIVTITTPTLQRAQLSPIISTTTNSMMMVVAESAASPVSNPELISPSCSTSRNAHYHNNNHNSRASYNRCSLSSAASSSSSSKESSPSSPSNAKHSYSFHSNKEATATISSQSSAISTTPSCSTLGSSSARHNRHSSIHRSPTLDNSLPPSYEVTAANLAQMVHLDDDEDDDDDDQDDEHRYGDTIDIHDDHDEFIIDYQRSQTMTETEGAMIQQQYLQPPASPRLQIRNNQRTVSTDSALAGEQTGANNRRIGHRRVNTDGEVTYKKIQSTQIMHSIQLGIGYMVGSLASKPERDLLMQDFMQIETVYFPKSGSQVTPAHHYTDFRFSTYTPTAFRYFRDLFRIQPDDFMLSINHEAMQELSNPGASGSVFYRTYDDKFIIKTVQRTEAKFLLKLLPGYFMNLSQNHRTLLPKFFGLYTYECVGQNIRLLVMNNLLPSCVKMHQKYDLKGSTYRRKASPQELQKESPVFKDLDFLDHYDLTEDFQHHQNNPNNLPLQEQQQQQKQLKSKAATLRSGSGSSADSFPMSNLFGNFNMNGTGALRLEAKVYDETMTSLEKDCRVLESFEIMDYSLLIGVHNYEQARREHLSAQSDNPALSVPYFDYDDDDSLPPGAIRAKNHKGERLLLFIGIIDILQSYRLTKKFEHAWKSFFHDGDTISVHKPSFYKHRFMDFMRRYVFRKIPAPQSTSLSTATISMEQIHELKRPKRKFRIRNIFKI